MFEILAAVEASSRSFQNHQLYRLDSGSDCERCCVLSAANEVTCRDGAIFLFDSIVKRNGGVKV